MQHECCHYNLSVVQGEWSSLVTSHAGQSLLGGQPSQTTAGAMGSRDWSSQSMKRTQCISG